MEEIGQELFRELVLNRPELADGYRRAVGYAEQAALSLTLHAPGRFLRLPFEALHSEDEGYLCLKYPMYRVVSECFFDREPLSTVLLNQLDSQGDLPRALVVASNTWESPDQEIPGVEQEVMEVSALLRARGFDVCSLSTDQATGKRVRDELMDGGYLLFHYAGHGSYNPDSPEKGALYFWEGAMGNSKVEKLTAEQLESLSRPFCPLALWVARQHLLPLSDGEIGTAPVQRDSSELEVGAGLLVRRAEVEENIYPAASGLVPVFIGHHLFGEADLH